MYIYDAKVDHLKNPMGFRMVRTVFSWKAAGAEGKSQRWARLRVALDAAMENILFDGGEDAQASSLAYNVPLELKPRTRYYWTVTVCSDLGEQAVSELQWFETGKMDEPWQASWISCDSAEARHPYFEKQVTRMAGKEVARARLYACGLGLYEAYYNGAKIGNEYLTPYSNDYNEWIQYQTYDVTKELQEDGKLSFLLGNGWYKGRFGFSSQTGDKGIYGDEWKLIAELVIDYTDGSSQTVCTDDTWTVTRSNITFSNIYDGEHVDDTLEPLAAEKAFLCEAPAGRLTDRMSLPVIAKEEFVPVQLIDTPAGEKVFDLGQEITGTFELRVNEPAGTVIHIQTGEVLQQGNFYNANLRTAKSEYYYTSGGTETVISPHFTFYGYRYVKVEGVSDLKISDFKGICLYSDFEEKGFVETGNELVNRLFGNVRWGMKDNFLDVPTDCPQRDERMGWTGDAQVFSPTATYMADTYAFYAKFLYDMANEQKALGGKVPDVVPSFGVKSCATVWGDAAVIIPWNLYLFYGDKSILEDQFESMRSWVDYITSVDGTDHGWRYVFHYGDWLALDNTRGNAEQTMGLTDEEFIANLYYAISAGIVAKAAKVLGRAQEEARYQALSDEQFDVVKKEYYSVTGRCCIKTQTALLLTLKYHLSDNEELVKAQLKKLFDDNKNKHTTGFVGTPLLCNVITDNGMEDIAVKLLLNEEYPGWLYEVKLGATTVWERWNSLLPDGTISGISMNSMNHYAYGSIMEWVFRHVAGIDVAESVPGSRFVNMAPILIWELGSVTGSYDSPAGCYKSSWKLDGPKNVTITVEVPFGCGAALKLPLAPQSVYADVDNPMFADVKDGVCMLAPGTYTVTYELTKSLKKSYNLDTPLREIMGDATVVQKLSRVIPLASIPQQFAGLSINQIMAKTGRKMDENALRYIESLLA